MSRRLAITGLLTVLPIVAAFLFGFRTSSVGAAEPSSPVAVLVEVPIPSGMDHSQIEAAMAKTVPTYQSAPGLIREYFIISDDHKLGGVYLWENRKTAEAWYNESAVWHAGVSKNSGLKAELTYFDVPIVTEGPALHP